VKGHGVLCKYSGEINPTEQDNV